MLEEVEPNSQDATPPESIAEDETDGADYYEDEEEEEQTEDGSFNENRYEAINLQFQNFLERYEDQSKGKNLSTTQIFRMLCGRELDGMLFSSPT